MPDVVEQLDLIVIGAGPGGYVAAIRAAQLGFKVAVVEKEKTLGGTCLNVGCIPSKAMLESSHHYHSAKEEFSDHGVMIDKVKLDLAKMLKRKEKVVESITGGVDFLFKKNKVTWLKGVGSFADKNTINVTDSDGNTKQYVAKRILIATGSRPIELPFARFDHKFIVDSTDCLSFSKVPEKLIVIGGGVIGLELGSVWSRLGSEVTVVEALDYLLGSTDKGVAQEMNKILKKQGIKFHLGTKLSKVTVIKNKIELVCEQKDKELKLEADKVLVAIGRRPLTAGLSLANIGVETDPRGFIKIDSNYKTNIDGVYAIGDVVPGPMLAHKAEEEGIAVVEHMAGEKSHVNYEAIPGIVYTWPEVATLGLSEEDCKEKSIPYKLGKFFFKANGRAKAMGQTDGFVKVLAHKDTDRLLGFHIVGANASEMIAEAVMAMEYKASAEDIARSVHAHPTLAECMKEAALAALGRVIHS